MEVKPGAKFCGKCGTKLDLALESTAETKGMEQLGGSGFVRWTLLPGQVAVKITESEVEACGKIKGISIQEGTKALVFVNGRIGAELSAGSYKLKELTAEGKGDAPESKGKIERLHQIWRNQKASWDCFGERAEPLWAPFRALPV